MLRQEERKPSWVNVRCTYTALSMAVGGDVLGLRYQEVDFEATGMHGAPSSTRR